MDLLHERLLSGPSNLKRQSLMIESLDEYSDDVESDDMSLQEHPRHARKRPRLMDTAQTGVLSPARCSMVYAALLNSRIECHQGHHHPQQPLRPLKIIRALTTLADHHQVLPPRRRLQQW